MPNAAFTTLGCKVNQYETQRILESFEEAGFGIVAFDDVADVYVINSCSVTSIAESKSLYTIRRATRKNPSAKVVVTGCAAQMHQIRGEQIPGADVVVPNPEKLDALAHLFRAFPELASRVRQEPRREANPPAGRTRATLKLQDGCNFYCSYCSIPFTRPGMVSRPAEEVLLEAWKIAEQGHREVVLTGVLIGAYGPETGSGGPDFESIVERIARESGISRVRISSIELRQVTDRLVGLIQDGHVVPHLHIPLQSGDTGVLADMNRQYTQQDYIDRCHALQRAIPDLSLTTDILVGFPTETDARFRSSVEVCEAVGFLKAHVFSFSPRHGTPADQWGDPISPEVKAERRTVLTETTQRTANAFRARFLGRTMEVLAEGKQRDGLLEGLTANYLTVQFPGPSALARSFSTVRLVELGAEKLIGELGLAEAIQPLLVRN